MSTAGDQGGLVLPLPVLRALRPNQSQHDALEALEQALTQCLVTLAQLASAAGEAERAARLSGAACSLGAEAPCARRRRATSRPSSSPLSDREHEVAGLIVHGLTNREIAEALVISERTADTHVQNILSKLGLVSRAQVAAWFVEHSPATGRPRAS